MPVMIVPLTAILATFFLSPVYESSTSILMNEASILPVSYTHLTLPTSDLV